MKNMKKLITLATLAMMLGSSTNGLNAVEYVSDAGGCGYSDCCRTTSLAPAIALGTIAVVAIVAVALQNTSGHSHCHVHVH
jgi:hypothetical protein